MGYVTGVHWLTKGGNLSLFLLLAINVSLAFCMGTDIESLLDNPIGQPMATIFFNSFGQKGTLAVWAIVVIVQCVFLCILKLWLSNYLFFVDT